MLRYLYTGLALLLFSAILPQNISAQGTTSKLVEINNPKLLLDSISSQFSKLQNQVTCPPKGYIKHVYLTPGGYYTQMWDWDGFFIGCYLASENKDNIKYLKWWVLNFASSVNPEGYVSGCITSRGPVHIFGKFAMKPFLSQGAYLASKWSGNFSWITPKLYNELKLVIYYREKTQYDSRYGLFFWVNAMQSGADNNVVLTNNKNDKSAILGVDINTFQLREYSSMSEIAERLGHSSDAKYFKSKADSLKRAMMKYLWFPKDHSFFNVRRDNGLPIRRISYSNFVPLIEGTKLLSKKEGRIMIKKYLWNPKVMLGQYGIRSLSRQDPAYNNRPIINPYSNWRGPVWIVANYLYFIGLEKFGFENDAQKLSVMLGNLVLKDIHSCGSMHEDYDADTGSPLAPTAKESKGGVFSGFVGWNLLVQSMLECTLKQKCMLLNID